MSDYFGALLRSSGVQVTGTARPLPSYPTQEDSPTPIDAQLGAEVTMPVPLAAEASVTPTTHAPVPEAPAMHSTLTTPTRHSSATQEVAERAEQRASEPIDPVAEAHTAMAADAPPDASQPVTPGERSMASESLSTQSLTRAVLRWVASDPAQVQRLTSHEPAPTAPVQIFESSDTAASVARPLPSSRAAQETSSQPWEQNPIVESTDDTLASFEASDEPLPRAATARASHATWLPADPLAPPVRAQEEVIEVSIGAVHVRVDAPPELAVSRAVAPAARTAATSAPSSLARRALRRV